MYLTKAEMEDIWHNKPFGHFNHIKKSLKNTKLYKVNVKPYIYNYLPNEVFEVRAYDVENANFIARYMWKEKYNDIQPEPDGWLFNHVQ